MRKLLNTLYITSPHKYLMLDGENIVISEDSKEVARLPLHNFEGIVSMAYAGASPALMGACADRNISLCFLTPYGRFLARVTGKVKGNVTLRKLQYEYSNDEIKSALVAKNFIFGKVYNSRWVLERAIRDHGLRVNVNSLKEKSLYLKKSLININNSCDLDQLRGYEGEAASVYFSVFDELILQKKEYFYFRGRNKRPPTDNVNSLLSFVYTLLTSLTASALETVGLDPYVGFLHRDRPGRVSLALDLIEELRSVFADRFVLSIINKRIVKEDGFIKKENGSIIMNEKTRNLVLQEWQKKKQDVIKHPYLEEKIEWGLVPYVQSMLLARYLRGDIDAYPPFLWK